jgi:signal transduction histidine kinase
MEQTEIISFIIISALMLFAFAISIIAFINQYRKKRLQHQNEKEMMEIKHKETLLTTQLEMQQQTMQYIGREIHDNVGQKLTLASIYAQQLSFENKAPLVNDKIENIYAIINDSLQELRKLSKSLTDDAIAAKDLVALIVKESETINTLKKALVTVNSNTDIIDIGYQQKSILLRVAQEFFQNSLKHANCTKINVDINKEERHVALLLTDNGKGFETTKNNFTGIGLKNMQKRIELLQGEFNLESSEGKGTLLNIRIPI